MSPLSPHLMRQKERKRAREQSNWNNCFQNWMPSVCVCVMCTYTNFFSFSLLLCRLLIRLWRPVSGKDNFDSMLMVQSRNRPTFNFCNFTTSFFFASRMNYNLASTTILMKLILIFSHFFRFHNYNKHYTCERHTCIYGFDYNGLSICWHIHAKLHQSKT